MKSSTKGTTMTFAGRIVRFVASAVAVALIGVTAASCSTSAAEGGTDSHTHWLDACQTDSDCGGLDCLCGVCTRECAATSECSGLGEGATCAALSACGAGGPATVCRSSSDGSGGSGSGSGGADGGPGSGGEQAAGGSGSGGADGGPGPGPCTAMDARNDGSRCAALLGYTWDGTGCVEVLCGCRGTDCDSLYSAPAACEADRAQCGGSGSGGAGAGSGGTDAGPGSGGTGTGGAPEGGAPHPCRAMDAVMGETDCAIPLGFSWNGLECTQVLCSCNGSACDSLYPTLAACEDARRQCREDVSEAQACTTADDCTYKPRTCCPCTQQTPRDVYPVRKDAGISWMAPTCSTEFPCPPCVPFYDEITPDCVLNRCVVAGTQCTPRRDPLCCCDGDVLDDATCAHGGDWSCPGQATFGACADLEPSCVL